MDRRQDLLTAEKISVALLSLAAFGRETAMRNALLSGLPPELIARVFSRIHGGIRTKISGIDIIKDRRQLDRGTGSKPIP